MFILILVFENYFAQELFLTSLFFSFFILKDNMMNVKDFMKALKDTLKFSNYTGKSFMIKLLQGNNWESFRGHLVKHHI